GFGQSFNRRIGKPGHSPEALGALQVFPGGVDQHDGVGGCSGLVGRTLTKRFPDPSVALRENRKAQQLQQDGRTGGWVSNATLSQECFTSDNPEFTFHIESNASD
ncbi:hypothetical protein KUCAC02_025073, partial [Chaenocephalus aceratus]